MEKKNPFYLQFSCEMENRKVMMRGNVLSGSLGGSWDNVRINNGNILINQQFTKYPGYEILNLFSFAFLIRNI